LAKMAEIQFARVAIDSWLGEAGNLRVGNFLVH